MNIRQIAKLVLLIVLCELLGAIGTIFTIPNIPTWYVTLTKPFFSPPNWLFGPVWTMLFLLMGVAFYLVLETKENLVKKKSTKNLFTSLKTKAINLFAIQFFFNILWSYLFFGLKSPLLGFIGIVFLWVAIVLTIFSFLKISKKAAYLLIPYILWVSFATILNLSILLLNP